jgi:hypothetical protein
MAARAAGVNSDKALARVQDLERRGEVQSDVLWLDLEAVPGVAVGPSVPSTAARGPVLGRSRGP